MRLACGQRRSNAERIGSTARGVAWISAMRGAAAVMRDANATAMLVLSHRKPALALPRQPPARAPALVRGLVLQRLPDRLPSILA